MGLTTALSNALSGLRVTQSSMDLASQNVSNAQTAGYTRKIQNNTMVAADGQVRGVSAGNITRAIDDVLSRSVRTQTTTQGYTNTTAQYLSRLDSLMGKPGSADAIDTLFNNFSTALQGLVTSPESDIVRAKVVSEAKLLTQRLNGVANDVNDLRSQTERTLADSVDQVNTLLGQIESLNKQVVSQSSAGGLSLANALDARDQAIQELSSYMDLRVNKGELNSVSISTSNGTVLFDGIASKLNFDGRDSLSPLANWSADSTQRDVGTLTVVNGNGSTFDLIAGKSIRSGSIAALIELRDSTFVDAQSQFDELASQLALSLSNIQTAGTAASASGATGFDIDLAGLQAGNSISVKINEGSVEKTYTFVKADTTTGATNASFGPSANGDKTVGINFSGGTASVVSQIQAALGSGFAATNPSGTTLRILDDGTTATTDVLSVTKTTTATSLTAGSAQLSLFVDPGSSTGYFTGSPDGKKQSTGFAQRISLNNLIEADYSNLVNFASGTSPGDPTRPQAILDALRNSTQTFSPNAKIGSVSTPYKGSVVGYLQRIISVQSGAAEAASNVSDAQDTVLSNLKSKFEEISGVDVDTEMANLSLLQQMYSANARVVSTINDMFDVILRMGQ